MEEKLLVVRQGSTVQRKQAVKDLAGVVDWQSLVLLIIPLLKDPQIEQTEAQKVLKLVIKLFARFTSLSLLGEIDIALATKLVDAVKTYILDLEEAQVALQAFIRATGLKTYISALRSFFTTKRDHERLLVAQCIAIAAQLVGVSLVVPLIRAMLSDKDKLVQLAGISVIPRLAMVMQRSSILPVLRKLVELSKTHLLDPQFSSAVNSGMVVLADCASPTGYNEFEPVMDSLWKGARMRREKLGFLRSLAAIAATSTGEKGPKVPGESTEASGQSDKVSTTASEIAESVFAIVSKEADSIPPSANRIFLNVLRRCAPFIIKKDLQTQFINLVFVKFWTSELRSSVLALSQLSVPASQVITSMIEHTAFRLEPNLSINLLARICPAPLVLSKRTEQLLAENMVSCCADPAISKQLPTAFKHVGQSISRQHLGKEWVPGLLDYMRQPEWEVRANCNKALASIAGLLSDESLKTTIYLKLVEELGEEYPEVLAEVINGLLQLVDIAEPESLLPKLTPILRNRNMFVQEQCIKLVKKLAQSKGESVSAREWMQVCFELLELQKSPRQTIRHEATGAFAAISAVVGPADVANTLVKHLKAPDRQFRVTTAAAIASAANETGAFAILPLLLAEYDTGDLVIQHGVLKALSFMAQFLDPNDLEPLVNSMKPLIDDALLDSNQVHRQTAASIVDSMAKASIGTGNERVFTHFLNELMPSIFETSPHVIDRVVEAISSICDVLGAPAFVNYIWAGLFHPARKVRNIYWQLWNEMYKKHAEELVSSYPVHVADVENPDVDIRDVWI